MAMNRQRRTSNINNVITYDALNNVTIPASFTVKGLMTAGFVKSDADGLFSVDTTIYQAALPSQTGNSGKYLTTNGSVLSWGTISTANIYNSDGTLTGNRVVTMGAFTLSFEKDLLVSGFTVGRGGGNIIGNNAFGFTALNNNTTGNANVAIGYEAMKGNTTGTSNIAYGAYALGNNTTGSSNVALGYECLLSNTGSNNIAIGISVLKVNTGTSNVGIGGQSNLLNNTTGSHNISIGTSSLTNNTTGSQNVSFGNFALGLNTTGSNNIGVGGGTLYYNLTGGSNTAIGYQALAGTTTSSNIGVGVNAGYYITGGVTFNSNPTNSIFIGVNTKANGTTQTNQIVIGHNETGLGSNTTIIGNASTITTAIRGRLILGTLSDTGLYQLDVNGTARVSGAGTFTTIDGTSALSLNQLTTATNSPILNLNYNQTGGGGGGLLTIISSSSSRYLANFNNYTYIDGGGRFVIGVAAFYGTNVLTTNGDIRINSSATNSITSTNGGLSLVTGSGADGILVNFTTATNGSGISVINTFSGGSGTGSCYTLDNRGNNRHLYFHNNTTNPTILTNSGSLLLGTTTENTSALLNVTSTTKGFLPPRMTTTQKNAIATPAAGLQVYDATLNVPSYYNGTAWVNPGSGSGTVTSVATTGPITGGTITTSGTIGITQATTSTDGYLSSTDWNTFNGKASENIYTSNGTLSGNRTVTTNGNSLTFAGGGSFGTNIGIGGTPNAINSLQVSTDNQWSAAFIGNMGGARTPSANYGIHLGWNYNTSGASNILWGTGEGLYPYLVFSTWNGTTKTDRVEFQDTGNVVFKQYQTATSFTGTPVGYLAFDTGGNILTVPVPSGGGSSLTLSAIGSSPNANGATLTGSALNLEPASASFGGVVTTGTQSFAGAKTFGSTVTATGFFESSDRNIKQLISDNYYVAGIGAITPKLYIKNDSLELGYFAQDFIGILDSAIQDSDGLLNLSYREVLVAKVYALEQEVKALKLKIN